MYRQSYKANENKAISVSQGCAKNSDVKFKDNRKTTTNMNKQVLMRKALGPAYSQTECEVKSFIRRSDHALPIQREAADSLTLAIDELDGQVNKQTHILAEKHRWDSVVDNPDWSNVKPIMKTVVNEGAESVYKGTSKKSSKTVGNVNGVDEETVDVTWVNPGGYYVSDGWVRS